MKIYNFCLSAIALLSAQYAGAANLNEFLNETSLGISCCSPCTRSNWCQIGNAGFNTQNPDDWYTLDTQTFPDSTTLSLNRNRGSTQGIVELTPTGITVGQAGNYFISITAILTNPSVENTPFIQIFLVRDGVFIPLDSTNLGGVGVVPYQQIVSIQASGVVEYVEAGTSFSIVATNGGGLEPQPVTVVGWGISTFRIPCDPAPQ